jgi:hypothetical protein
MADQVLIYISAASDLGLEREILGRAITEIPTTLAWRIIETPFTSEEPDLAALVKAEIHMLILGTDVRAPVGVEWLASRQAGHKPILFLKAGTAHTPAAQAFKRELERHTRWRHFIDAADLRKQVLILLTDHLLSEHEYYKLTEQECDTLRKWRQGLKKSKRQQVNDTRGGADNSSIILSTERYIPSEGVLLHDPKLPNNE